MKIPLLTFFFYSFLAASQPVIDAADYSPVLDQTFTSARSAPPVSVQKEGAAGFQTWDLSDLNGQMTNTTNYWSPDQDFPETSFRRLESQFGIHHIDTTTDGWYSYGSTLWVFEDFHDMVYQDYLKLMSFPFTMGSSYTDTFSGTFSDINGSISGTLTAGADGYGTLITPAGTWTNVLRVHSVLSYTAINTTSGETENYYKESYEWYKEGLAHELAGIHYFTDPPGLLNSAAYLVSPLSIHEEEADRLLVFPNPAKDKVTIELRSDEAVGSVTAVDLRGVMHDLAFFQQQKELQTDISGLADGIYCIRVISGFENAKWVVISVGGF